MSASRRTPSPNDTAAAKVKDPWQRMEEDWTLISEAELDPILSDDEGTVQLRKREKEWQLEEWREAEERRACEEAAKKAREEAEEACKVQEGAAKKEREEREAAMRKAWEAAEAWADAEQRALEERLWDAAAQRSETAVAPPWVAKPGGRMSVAGPSIPGQRASGVQEPCTQCHNKGTLCVLGAAKGKTTACEACRHTKVSCS
ncbi:hypothetical protein ID866_12491 [Astraeus odoratus]|nr:hypothetical protein ID866_12491 [Astraeus odoratus]